MNGKYVLDTNIIIYHFRGLSPWTEYINALNQADVCVSVITRMELLAWKEPTPEAERHVLTFLNKLNIALLSPAIEAEAISLRRKTSLKLPDAIVAATAVISDAMLVTNDKTMCALNWPNLKVINPTLFFS
jgi:predicted nucleic acid-binding protein